MIDWIFHFHPTWFLASWKKSIRHCLHSGLEPISKEEAGAYPHELPCLIRGNHLLLVTSLFCTLKRLQGMGQLSTDNKRWNQIKIGARSWKAFKTMLKQKIMKCYKQGTKEFTPDLRNNHSGHRLPPGLESRWLEVVNSVLKVYCSNQREESMAWITIWTEMMKR